MTIAGGAAQVVVSLGESSLNGLWTNHRLAIQVVSREKLRELREQEGAQAVRDAKQRFIISAVSLVASLALVVFTVRRRS